MFRSNPALRLTRLAERLAQPLFKQQLLRTARVVGPTLVALAFSSVAHAQGTIDFTGANTLMTSFKTTIYRKLKEYQTPAMERANPSIQP